MKVYNDISLKEFVPWSGAVINYQLLTVEELDMIEEYLEYADPNDHGYDETEINDFFWFEDELIAVICGYESYDEFWEDRNR